MNVLALLTLLATAIQDPTPISAPIAEVTVFPSGALVRRRAEVPAEVRRLVLAGLPSSMDPDSVRVRCAGAAVVGTESRERFQRNVPDARLQELRERQRAIQREISALDDEAATAKRLAEHLERSLAVEPPREGEKPALANFDGWSKHLDFVTGELTRLRTQLRDVERRKREASVRLEDVSGEIAAGGDSRGVNVRDVTVELAGATAATLDVEYLIGPAGWRPEYDLRASSDARKVELGYRGSVWQTSGEDWNDVELALSTAAPHLGAQGPDPEPIWLRFAPQARYKDKSGELRGRRPAPAEKAKALRLDEEANDEDDYSAESEFEGLSTRFRVARRETIASRNEPASVLIGQATLEATPEYFCTPERDANVWLRGRTTNSSEWTLLPGRAAVYFGADFLGHSQLEAVQPGAEFTLHLGLDPALAVERTQLEDVVQGPGVFSSRETHREAFRIRVENHGAAIARADGAAVVFVRETLPRSKDERLEVELASPSPKPSDDSRWKKDQDEKGFVTWVLAVPRGGESVVQYVRNTSYPEGAVVQRR